MSTIFSQNHTISLVEYGAQESDIEKLLEHEFDEVESIGDNIYQIRTSVGSAVVDNQDDKLHPSVLEDEYENPVEISGAEGIVERARSYLDNRTI
ncbi:hypothetical protein [Candidatus Nanohalobium constans]|uniref:Uncharacterized protein n=1 Tax=Candidatus Nanohalobium constans TaxID=2565781 RepID=A0A5Q0UH06_9ARCH|nr:hypothetical protein [Candidatus Nanohalobium constans]QGA80866.1 hypothetical protein LC1Nh_0987 [Candidatus Nanohalobium constans]